MATEIIGYLRVSTKKQGESGLGLEGQKAAVEAYARHIGARVGAWYTEVETGKLADRPQLNRALSHGKRSKSPLVVAKLDRLARNVEFLAKVMNSGVEFTACDNPAANRLTLHILAAVAEAEAKAISDRTKAALAAAKARGMKLGSARPGHWQGHEEARLAGAKIGTVAAAKARTKAAEEAYADLLPKLDGWKAEGLSLRSIADKLNAEGHTTRRGKPWNQVQVSRVLERASVIA
ncbi:MAG TPA: recombinase family protein [Gemmataceae bacterium]|nr:recombinase family protein [Gemmataceae bacterium]